MCTQLKIWKGDRQTIMTSIKSRKEKQRCYTSNNTKELKICEVNKQTSMQSIALREENARDAKHLMTQITK